MLALALAMRCSRDVPGDDVYIGKPAYSPDHAYMAVLFTSSGGGGISPWCINDVGVVPASPQPGDAYARKFRVYEGGCHSLGFVALPNGARLLENGPKLKWLGPRVLEITFNPRLAKMEVRHLVFAKRSEDGRVAVVAKYFP